MTLQSGSCTIAKPTAARNVSNEFNATVNRKRVAYESGDAKAILDSGTAIVSQ